MLDDKSHQTEITMRTTFALMIALALTGCGVEVAGTAAVIGAAQTQEAEQAKQQKEHIEQRLNALEHDIQQRAAAAGEGQ